MTVLIDTNVILDYVLKRDGSENALACLELLLAKKAKLWLTDRTISDVYYLTRRDTKDKVFTKAIVTMLLNSFKIVSVDKADCAVALNLDMIDYEDALMSVCAKKVKAMYILTRNAEQFTNAAVPALSPADFLEIHTTL